MSKNMLRISAKELKTIRVKCKGTLPHNRQTCDMIYEVSLDRLANAFPKGGCPQCNTSYMNNVAAGPQDVLSEFARCLEILTVHMNSTLEIEFDLPAQALEKSTHS